MDRPDIVCISENINGAFLYKINRYCSIYRRTKMPGSDYWVAHADLGIRCSHIILGLFHTLCIITIDSSRRKISYRLYILTIAYGLQRTVTVS